MNSSRSQKVTIPDVIQRMALMNDDIADRTGVVVTQIFDDA